MSLDPRRPRWKIDDVLARTDLAALLDQLTEPAAYTERGRRWHCPVVGHDDRHASVTIHTDYRGHERWRCWSGDDTHRGDALDLITTTQHLSRADAIDWLANRAGMIPDQPLPSIRRAQRPPPVVVPLDPAVVQYVTACERILWTTQAGRPILDWLHRRGFPDDLLHANHVGADPGRKLMPRRRGLPHGTSQAATFPALDPAGAVTYVQARYLEPGDGPKYDNPARRLGLNPRVAFTRSPQLERDDVFIVCEGIPDALTAANAGYQAVAILGAQAPDRTVAVRLTESAAGRRLIAVVDADLAGQASGERLAQLAEAAGGTLRVVSPPDAADLNEWAQLDSRWPLALHSEPADAGVEPETRSL